MLRRNWVPIALVVAAAGLAGCIRMGGPTTHPVTGTIRVDGKPATSALVTFHPVGATAGAVRPTGRVGEDGSFTLTTHEGADGAPAGDYRVTVVWTRAVTRKKAVSDGDDVPVRNLLPARYGNPESTPLTATVGDGANENLVFEIKTTAR